VLLLASTIGLSVASNYYAQPLLHRIGAEFSLSTTSAGGITTAAQLSYALGLLLIVPLGDIAERRRLIVLMMLLTAGRLVLTATAGHVALVLLGTAVASVSSVLAQILRPFAAMLAAPHERGRIVGTMMSG
jgi:predicted MFS family arabinose efflux permease